MIKRVAITGPTGAIGMALINNCIQNSINVLAICHKGSKRIAQIPKSPYVRIIEANLDEYEGIDASKVVDEKCDLFIHLAWNGTFGDTRNDVGFQADNIKYSLEAVNLAARLGCTVFVGAGSQAEYGKVSEPLRPDTPTFPENGYGVAKLAAGNLTRIRCEQLGIKHIWTRILSVYGPFDGNYTMVMGTLIKMLAGEKTHFTEGKQIWNYLFSEDAAKMILWLAQNGDDGKVYCLGSNEARPLREYIEIMYKQTGSKAELGFGDIPYNNGQVMCLCVAESPIKDFEFTSFEEGIKRTVASLKQ